MIGEINKILNARLNPTCRQREMMVTCKKITGKQTSPIVWVTISAPDPLPHDGTQALLQVIQLLLRQHLNKPNLNVEIVGNN